jgi:hypothetical protein
MPHCCGCPYPHHCCYPWAVYEESLPPHLRPSVGPSHEDDIRRLEEERDRQKRRLRQLEQELEELRRQRRTP